MDHRGLAEQGKRGERGLQTWQWVTRLRTAWTGEIVHDAQGVGGSSPSRPTLKGLGLRAGGRVGLAGEERVHDATGCGGRVGI
jgi:hypothetical protein